MSQYTARAMPRRYRADSNLRTIVFPSAVVGIQSVPEESSAMSAWLPYIRLDTAMIIEKSDSESSGTDSTIFTLNDTF
jgi:hypothetical protein